MERAIRFISFTAPSKLCYWLYQLSELRGSKRFAVAFCRTARGDDAAGARRAAHRRIAARGWAQVRSARFQSSRCGGAIFDLLVAIGEDPLREGLRDTPARVARAFRETFAGLYADPDDVLTTVFDEDHDELVLVRQIPMYSTCEHHLVPFHGVAHVGYLPGADGRVTGLSKIARLVDLYARRPQVQERLTAQIADAFMRKLKPRGVIVVVEAEHLCMSMRGRETGRRHHHLSRARPVQRRCGGQGRGTASAAARVMRCARGRS